MVMAFSILSPLRSLELEEYFDFTGVLYEEGLDIAKEAYADTQDQISGVIKVELAAYIMTEARARGVEITVDFIRLDQEGLGPEMIYLSGDLMQARRSGLTGWLESELAIGEGNQIWNGENHWDGS